MAYESPTIEPLADAQLAEVEGEGIFFVVFIVLAVVAAVAHSVAATTVAVAKDVVTVVGGGLGMVAGGGGIDIEYGKIIQRYLRVENQKK